MSWEPFKMFEAMIEGLPPLDKETLAAAIQDEGSFRFAELATSAKELAGASLQTGLQACSFEPWMP